MLIVGIMSGTSLDGLDITACKFWKENEKWKFDIIHAETIEYNKTEIDLLKNAYYLPGIDLIALHHHYGSLIGQRVKDFCFVNNIQPDYIASHGHTIFHQPQKGFTFQLGHGSNIAAMSGIKTICDFRTSDVAYGGQGAPLVPIGDEMLFNEYDYCLNLGGISNISYKDNGIRKAFDIGICNMALNSLAEACNLKFDKDGLIAQSGFVDELLLEQLTQTTNSNHINKQSLGYEWYVSHLQPILSHSEATIANKMRTFCEFIANQIADAIKNEGNILVTGGGAKNNFLQKCIQNKTKAQIIIPNVTIIDFKEALIFAFLGMLRVNHQPNCLKSVTGALKDNIGACIYLP